MSKTSQTMNQKKQSPSVVDLVQSMTSHSDGMPTSKKTKSALTLTFSDQDTEDSTQFQISADGSIPDFGKICQANIASLKPYCDIYNNCANQKTNNLENCLDSLSNFICTQKLNSEDKDGLCYSANGLVELSQSKNIGNNAEILMDWYKNKLSPCVASQCKDSMFKVNQTDFENAPDILVKDLCTAAGGGGTEAGLAIFFRDYWWIFLIIIVIIIILLISFATYEYKK